LDSEDGDAYFSDHGSWTVRKDDTADSANVTVRTEEDEKDDIHELEFLAKQREKIARRKQKESSKVVDL